MLRNNYSAKQYSSLHRLLDARFQRSILQAFSMAATRWGILGAGRISNDFCAALLTHSPGKHEVLAVATASDKERAGKFADRFDIPRHYGSYLELVNDKDIDIIYVGVVSLYNKKPCVMALNAGKPVLCEAPLCNNESETKEVVELAKERNIFFMEGIWNQCLPVYEKLREELARIGEPQVVTVTTGYDVVGYDQDGKNLKIGFFKAAAGYLIMNAKTAFKEEPRKIVATGTVHPQTDADLWSTVTLHYGKNRFATFVVSSEIELNQELMIYGPKGWIKVPEYFVAPTKLVTHAGVFEKPFPETKYKMNNPGTGGFIYIQDHVRECLKKGLKESPLVTLSQSVNIARIVDEARRQLRAEKEDSE